MGIHSTHLLSLAALTTALVTLPAAAAETRLTVNEKGELRATAAVLRKLRVKAGPDRRIWMQFPVAPRPKPPRGRSGPGAAHGHSHEMEPIPPKVWLNVQRDGSIVIRRMRLPGTNRYVPGAPGTVYVATGEGDRLILRKPGASGH